MHCNRLRLPTWQQRPHFDLLVTASREDSSSIILPSRAEDLIKEETNQSRHQIITTWKSIYHPTKYINRSKKTLGSYRLIMWYGCLWLTVPTNNLPTPHLNKTQNQTQVPCIIHSYITVTNANCKLNSIRKATWLSQEVATSRLLLGLKLRLETESPGFGSICIFSRKHRWFEMLQ